MASDVLEMAARCLNLNKDLQNGAVRVYEQALL